MKLSAPTRITLIYAVFGVLWIFFSDRLLDLLTSGVQALSILQTFKGFFFIILTSVILHFLVRTGFRRLEHSESSLRNSEARFRAVFERSTLAKALTLPDKRLLEVNTAFCEMLGYDRETLQTKTFEEITHPDDIEKNRNFIKRILAGEISGFGLDKRYIRSDGEVVWARIGTALLRDANDEPLYFITDILDITESKVARETLRRQRELLAQILDNIPLMVDFFDADMNILWINRAFEQTLGYSLEQMQNPDIWDRACPDPKDQRRVIEFIRAAEGKWQDFTLHTADGSVLDNRWMNIRLSDGTFIGIGEDVTRRRRAEAREREMSEQLLQVQRLEAVGRLAGGVAHDFNNILGVILGYAELMSIQPEGEPRDPKNAEAIIEAALRARDLTRQLLAFSRKQVLDVRPVDINDVVQGFQKLLQRVIGEDIRLEIDRSGHSLPVRADASQLEQVLMNLAVNARDAMPKGGVLSIETSRANTAPDSAGMANGPCALVRVRDTGTGMDAETLGRIFEPFFTTKSVEKGTGLGLSTSYGIIKQHGGDLQARSEPGKGSCFAIFLPLTGEKAEAEPEKAPEPEQAPASAVILVVEDDVRVRELACRVLSDAGYRVIESKTPAHAVDIATRLQEPIDLLLSDVVMPGMNGPEVHRRVAEHHPDMAVLFMSGYSEDFISSQGFPKRDGSLLQKPFSIQSLTQRVRRALAEKKAGAPSSPPLTPP